MAFTVQDDTGEVSGANSYGSVAEFDTYVGDRGYDVSAYSTSDKEEALVNASDYVDMRYKYIGIQKVDGQTTEFPRLDAFDKSGRLVSGVPLVIKEATFEYAFRALSAGLAPDPTQDTTGKTVVSERVKADVVESETKYSEKNYSLPNYPIADRKLKTSGLTTLGGNVVRG